jgi:hypothetical protein
VFVVSFAIAMAMGRASDNTGSSPVLVELFTSEGCSSCPPADALLQKMDAAQPVPGAQLIVLSEHVDYWNHDGWKDPYSSALLTERQSSYCRALRVSDPYTPQFIIGGIGELRANDPQQTGQLFQKAEAATKVALRISSVSVEATTPPLLRGRLEADGNSEERNADVYVAIALDHAESQVLRGENSGQHLTHVAVVQSLTKVGRLEKGKSFGQDFHVKLKPGTDPANVRIIAFAQESGPGRVLAAALQKAPIK